MLQEYKYLQTGIVIIVVAIKERFKREREKR